MLEIEGNILDVFNESIYPAKIIIHENKILKIKKSTLEYKNYILPGYIDAHVHIESSLFAQVDLQKLLYLMVLLQQYLILMK